MSVPASVRLVMHQGWRAACSYSRRRGMSRAGALKRKAPWRARGEGDRPVGAERAGDARQLVRARSVPTLNALVSPECSQTSEGPFRLCSHGLRQGHVRGLPLRSADATTRPATQRCAGGQRSCRSPGSLGLTEVLTARGVRQGFWASSINLSPSRALRARSALECTGSLPKAHSGARVGHHAAKARL